MKIHNSKFKKSKHINVALNFATVKSYSIKEYKLAKGYSSSKMGALFKTEKQSDIGNIESISIVEYEIKFGVDLMFALNRGASIIKITAVNDNDQKKIGSIFQPQEIGDKINLSGMANKQLTPEQFIKNLLTNFIDKVNHNAIEKLENIIVSTNVDLTTKIRNDFIDEMKENSKPLTGVSVIQSSKINSLASTPYSALKEGKGIITRKTIVSITGDKNKETISEPDESIYELTPITTYVRPKSTVDAFINIERNMPPLAVGDGTMMLDTIANLGASIPSNDSAKMYKGKIFAGPSSEMNDVKPVSTKVEFKETNFAIFKSKLKILSVKRYNEKHVPGAKKQTIPGKIKLNFEMCQLGENNKGTVVASTTKVLDHHQLLRYHTIIRKKPTVTIGRRSNGVLLSIKQNDINAKGIIIYKKILHRNSIEKPQFKIFKKFNNITPSKGFVKVNDSIPTSRSVIYRVVPLGIAGQGNIFTDVVTNTMVKNIELNNEKTNCVIITNLIPGKRAIHASIYNVPTGVIALKILRRNLTRKERNFKIIQIIDVYNGVGITDQGIINNNVYEYTCVLIYASGSEIQSHNSSIIEHVEISNVKIQVDVKIINKHVSKSGGNLNPSSTFEIIEMFQDGEEAVIENVLNKTGLIQYYQDEMKNLKDEMKNLIFHKIQRISMASGKVTELGIVTENKFSDKELALKNNVPPPKFDQNYIYRILTYFRLPSQLIPNSKKTYEENNPIKKYNVEIFKYFNGVTENNGTIMTRYTVKANHPGGLTTLGPPVSIKEINVSYSQVKPGIKSAKFKSMGNGETEVTWSIVGNAGLIDSFIISMIKNNNIVIVGTVHALAGGAKFKFYHKTRLESNKYESNLIDIKDNIQYVIQPVYHDYTLGAAKKTVRKSI